MPTYVLPYKGRDDTLTVKFLSLTSNPMGMVGELPIKLARKCVQVVGSSIIEEDAQDRTQVSLDAGLQGTISWGIIVQRAMHCDKVVL